jgi:carboxylesterase type B
MYLNKAKLTQILGLSLFFRDVLVTLLINLIPGIPYAEPPIKNLRFRNPVYTKGWTGVRDGAEHGESCPKAPMIGIGATRGSEDCLFLNVYTPQIVGSLPVMVHN